MSKENAALSDDLIETIRSSVDTDPTVRRARNAVTESGLDKSALDRDKVTTVHRSMSTKLDKWPVTNQKKSGRCWLFASLNLMRPGTMEKLGVKEFEFSQNYALFWDKFERSNYFLESMIELADEPLDSRTVQFMLSDVLGDGGQWDMLAAIYKRHGVVPKESMPETHASSNTARMNSQLALLLRRGALELRDMVADGKSTDQVEAAKADILRNVYQILTINLGVPPKEFDWQWEDSDGNFHRDGVMTPLEFLEKYVDIDLDDYVCLVDDPRREHPKNSTLTVDHLGNVVGGQPVLYLNVDVDVMKKSAADSLRSGEPVWFGCDVGQQSSRDAGLMVDELYAYGDTLGVDLTTTKEQRVLTGESLMTHAMLLVGVDEVNGKPRRWRVENSWGDEIGDKGFFTMDDDWFTEYVFEVVVKKSTLPPELQAALSEPPLVLPAWDPMGALA